jgi:hypothetical protein
VPDVKIAETWAMLAIAWALQPQRLGISPCRRGYPVEVMTTNKPSAREIREWLFSRDRAPHGRALVIWIPANILVAIICFPILAIGEVFGRIFEWTEHHRRFAEVQAKRWLQEKRTG